MKYLQMTYFGNVKTNPMYPISADFMKDAEFVKYGFNNTPFTATNKASKIDICLCLYLLIFMN